MSLSTVNLEGIAAVPGARLAYKLAGTPSGLPLMVFENGWGASYECWAWLETHLAPHVRLLFYNRAGIGGSEVLAPQSVTGLSAQFAALLDVLGVDEPVVAVGHSYGGLMVALHASQAPAQLRALVELDTTPARSEPAFDRQLKAIGWAGRLSILCARLGIPDPLFGVAGKRLPAPSGRRMMERSFQSIPSIRSALHELSLLEGLRAAIECGDGDLPHLIASAGAASEVKSWVGRLIASQQQARAIVAGMQAQHRERAQRCARGVWEILPYDHGDMIFSDDGAQASAARALAFVQSLA